MIDDDSPNTLINSDLLQKIEGKFLRIELYHHGKAHRVSIDELPYTIGRDQGSCNITVNKSVVSREHCVIDIKDNQIGVMDRSTNGTVVKVGEANGVIIRDEFYPLTGKGCLTLGEPFDSDDKDLILFKVIFDRG